MTHSMIIINAINITNNETAAYTAIIEAYTAICDLEAALYEVQARTDEQTQTMNKAADLVEALIARI